MDNKQTKTLIPFKTLIAIKDYRKQYMRYYGLGKKLDFFLDPPRFSTRLSYRTLMSFIAWIKKEHPEVVQQRENILLEAKLKKTKIKEQKNFSRIPKKRGPKPKGLKPETKKTRRRKRKKAIKSTGGYSFNSLLLKWLNNDPILLKKWEKANLDMAEAHMAWKLIRYTGVPETFSNRYNSIRFQRIKLGEVLLAHKLKIDRVDKNSLNSLISQKTKEIENTILDMNDLSKNMQFLLRKYKRQLKWLREAILFGNMVYMYPEIKNTPPSNYSNLLLATVLKQGIKYENTKNKDLKEIKGLTKTN